jgi:drug/metabolite transporter (DMT)-like permease
MKKNHITFKVFLLIIATDINESIAQIFLKKGLNWVGMDNITTGNLADFFLKSFTSPFVWAGMAVFLINFFLWITVLSRVDLSVAFPVGSTSYIYVPLLSILFLHEVMNPMRWAGIILIIAGIHFVSKSTHA